MKLKDFLKEIQHEYKYTECNVEEFELVFVIRGHTHFEGSAIHYQDVSNLPITKYIVDIKNEQVLFFSET